MIEKIFFILILTFAAGYIFFNLIKFFTIIFKTFIGKNNKGKFYFKKVAEINYDALNDFSCKSCPHSKNCSIIKKENEIQNFKFLKISNKNREFNF